MSIGFIIITIGRDKRKTLAEMARVRLSNVGLEEVTGVRFVDGTIHDLDEELKRSGVRLSAGGAGMHKGEVGLWLSTVNSLRAIADGEHDHVILLEDDAVVKASFYRVLPQVMKELPADYDFFAWAVPQNQRIDYSYDRWFDEDGSWTMNVGPPITKKESPHYLAGTKYVCKAYQGYRAVAIMYSKKGARKFLDLIEELGISSPTDIMLFTKHHTGYLDGYTFFPEVRDVIDHKETGTTVRSTGMYL